MAMIDMSDMCPSVYKRKSWYNLSSTSDIMMEKVGGYWVNIQSSQA